MEVLTRIKHLGLGRHSIQLDAQKQSFHIANRVFEVELTFWPGHQLTLRSNDINLFYLTRVPRDTLCKYTIDFETLTVNDHVVTWEVEYGAHVSENGDVSIGYRRG